jgi:hypothetical protein
MAMTYKLYRDPGRFTLTGPRTHSEGEGVYGHVERIGLDWHATGPWGPQPGQDYAPQYLDAIGALLFGIYRERAVHGTVIALEAIEGQDQESRELLEWARDKAFAAEFAARATGGIVGE